MISVFLCGFSLRIMLNLTACINSSKRKKQYMDVKFRQNPILQMKKIQSEIYNEKKI